MITKFKIFENSIDSIWVAISTDYEDGEYVYLDAWETEDDDEEGEVIAKIKIETSEVIYIDERTKYDKYSQNVIKELIISDDFKKMQYEQIQKKYNL